MEKMLITPMNYSNNLINIVKGKNFPDHSKRLLFINVCDDPSCSIVDDDLSNKFLNVMLNHGIENDGIITFPNGYVTHNDAYYILTRHRNEVPKNEIEKIRMFLKKI